MTLHPLNKAIATIVLALPLLGHPGARAQDMPTFELTIKSGRFVPDTIEVPAKTKFRLRIHNAGPGPEEFESSELRKEKVLAEGASSFLIFQPLQPGSYRFFGEFHPETAQGRLIAR